MAQKPWKSSASHDRRPPETISGIARRYHACAVAFATTLGIPLAEALQAYHGPVTAIFIETSHAELRLPASVQLPVLMPTPPNRAIAEAIGVDESTVRHDVRAAQNYAPHHQREAPVGDVHEPAAENSAPAHEAEAMGEPLPVVVPEGLPCSGTLLVDLRPPQLSLLLGKVAALAATKQGAWSVLLTALQAERQARLAKGRKPRLVPGSEATVGRGVDGAGA
jgi:hypothetical protein